MVQGVGVTAGAILCCVLLAGCSTGGGSDIVVIDSAHSEHRQDVPAAPATAPPQPPRPGDAGHVAGYVVDETFKVLPQVLVELPAFNLSDRTDRRGEFEFADLPPGTYLLQINHTGFLPVRTMIDVPAGAFARLQVILRPVPPEDPYHVTMERGAMFLLTGVEGPLSLTTWDSWHFHPDPGRVHTAILEAYMDPHQGGTGHNGFRYSLTSGSESWRGTGANPLRVELAVNHTTTADDWYGFGIAPVSWPTPEVDKQVEVFLTLFYNGPPPPEWSVAARPS